ncbi:hypothetical protein [Pseudobacteriovorax antillogorgiicola]|uniref:Transglutaminase elicitor n=1 Tax=Pseudobacteriovorax antillogorgiicola TaxID=1513793 RepID=A0A1Y6CUE7_9BACT|nr:hypothetical protein [Pseudobacteriovorax antillogorgiicola]TCS44438.1 transglutaminase elicitor [Pseudobacteriovorax antillogorgiicola]SMF78821.1 Transglutaminase elicitor [Pseudobacteriovorax antillogorgiicola]
MKPPMVRTALVILPMALIVSLHWSCDHFRTRARAYNLDTVSPYGNYSRDELELRDISDFYKRVFGGSEDDYWTEWSKLDEFKSGSVTLDRIPYLDSWYPERQKGTNIEGALTKYDKVFNGSELLATDWEAKYNSREEPSWYGHCNGTSVAAARFQNPLVPVGRPVGCEQTNTCIDFFEPRDIRALLSEINMNAKAKFISGNRCRKPQSELDALPAIRTDPTTMDDCDDVNPASFHVGLVNFLGRKKQPVIFDMNRDIQVWNYPIYEYSYTSEELATEELALERLGLNLDQWVFNPDAKSWQFIEMTISYRKARSDFQGAGTKPDPSKLVYTYILELDGEGRVVGGEWVGESRRSHPDFLWMAFEPAPPTGSSSRGNPHVDVDEVISIWAESVGLDPNNPFRDKPGNTYDIRFYPKPDIEWGFVEGYYQVLLDGGSSGTIFRGKKSHLRIIVEEPLKKGSEVEVFLNGDSLVRKAPADGRLDLVFDSPRGVNYLRFEWFTDPDNLALKASEVNWEFRYYAM